MKKVLLTLLSFLSFFFACMEIEPTRIAVTSVILSATSIELEEGGSHVLTATVSPKDAENKTVIWTSSNVSVATVSNGIVTACKLGNAIITATTDDGGKTANCEVTVNAKIVPVTSISLNFTSIELTEGEELTLTATINPDNATNKTVFWASSNPSVVSVVDGKITALSAGNAEIIVETEDGRKIAVCKVTVIKEGNSNESLDENEGNW